MMADKTYSNFHALASNKFHAAHDILLHLYELRKLLCEVWTKLACGISTESMS